MFRNIVRRFWPISTGPFHWSDSLRPLLLMFLWGRGLELVSAGFKLFAVSDRFGPHCPTNCDLPPPPHADLIWAVSDVTTGRALGDRIRCAMGILMMGCHERVFVCDAMAEDRRWRTDCEAAGIGLEQQRTGCSEAVQPMRRQVARPSAGGISNCQLRTCASTMAGFQEASKAIDQGTSKLGSRWHLTSRYHTWSVIPHPHHHM